MLTPVNSGFGTIVTDELRLRELVPTPDTLALDKVIYTLDDHVRRFIANCPYAILSTADSRGDCDASPRGGEPGFIKVIDETRILIPESTGNRRGDSFRNIIENPSIGMLFLIPGYEETLRINGRAAVTEDREFLARYVSVDKPPTLGIGVTVQECYLHCAKASLRASLWNPMGWPDLSEFPAAAEIFRDHSKARQGDGSVEHMERLLHESYTKRL
jgi:uncharacterized protein